MNYNICDENITRKIDSLGRVSIPSGLRSRYGFNFGDELNYKDSGIDPKYEIAFETLKELGCEVPAALNDVIYGD